MLEANRRCIVYVPDLDLHKLGRGIVLPTHYRLVLDRGPTWAPESQSWVFLVESDDRNVPLTEPGHVFPSLQLDRRYDAIVALPFGVPGVQ